MSESVIVTDATVVETLTALAATVTGFAPEAILPNAIRGVARSLMRAGFTTDQIVERARQADPGLLEDLCQNAVVGETFFFRQPEHFEYLAREFVPAHRRSGTQILRAWSAGCATGEEAYSLAATLLAAAEPNSPLRLEVLGTDLLQKNVQIARTAAYSASALRASAPQLYPTVQAIPGGAGGALQVDPRVRAITSFSAHNVLDPPPVDGGRFDIVLCRNVLVYFSPEGARRATANLASAVAPGGRLVFGPVDVREPPPGFLPAGPPELQIFTRPPPSRTAPPASPPGNGRDRSPPSVGPRTGRPEPAAQATRPPEPVALHLRALFQVERGDRRGAEVALADLCASAPDYIPGLLERALLLLRGGNRRAAIGLMQELLRRADAVPPEQVVAGPEPLPVRFYVDSVRAFLEREGKPR